MIKKFTSLLIIILIVLAGITAIYAAIKSLNWRYVLDSPLMIYMGYLLSEGEVPYRDFFDMNMPGTYFIMSMMGNLLGWNDAGSRIFDLICLVILSVSTFFWTRRFGWLPGLTASILFPLWYIREGPLLSLQREYLALIPFSLLLVVTTAELKISIYLRALIAGFFAALAVLIKPFFVLLALPPLIFLIQEEVESKKKRNEIIVILIGFFLLVGGVIIYLAARGALIPFLEIAWNYWPLYSHLAGNHQPISGLLRIYDISFNTIQGVLTFYLPVAVVGLIVLNKDEKKRKYLWLMVSLIVASIIYPALSGQFWRYHWIPFYYIILCASSLIFLLLPMRDLNFSKVAVCLCLILILVSLPIQNIENIRTGLFLSAPKNGIPDEISNYLKRHLEPGDTVQPLDWSGGAVHGMLMAKAPLATRFIYDFHFYHHISSPYIQDLRSEFINELEAESPRFIIQVLEDKPWPNGPDTTTEFPELKRFLQQNYSTVFKGNTYRILERNISE